jgi:hypothetical protein
LFFLSPSFFSAPFLDPGDGCLKNGYEAFFIGIVVFSMGITGLCQGVLFPTGIAASTENVLTPGGLFI